MRDMVCVSPQGHFTDWLVIPAVSRRGGGYSAAQFRTSVRMHVTTLTACVIARKILKRSAPVFLWGLSWLLGSTILHFGSATLPEVLRRGSVLFERSRYLLTVNYGLAVWACCVVNVWNSLPDTVVSSATVTGFKLKLKSLNFSFDWLFSLLTPLCNLGGIYQSRSPALVSSSTHFPFCYFYIHITNCLIIRHLFVLFFFSFVLSNKSIWFNLLWSAVAWGYPAASNLRSWSDFEEVAWPSTRHAVLHLVAGTHCRWSWSNPDN